MPVLVLFLEPLDVRRQLSHQRWIPPSDVAVVVQLACGLGVYKDGEARQRMRQVGQAAVRIDVLALEELVQVPQARVHVTDENKFQIGQLYQGVASRLGESDWNEALNAFLDDFIGSDAYNEAYAEWLQVPTGELPEAIEGVSFTVAQ